MEQTLGRLEQIIDLRGVWKGEAIDFTPWLASTENLALLGDTIGIDLELEAQEKDVGPFRADILCKDTSSNGWVLIENQLEQTDHTHLGQLMTYAPKLQAATIVWIAQHFREEHRAALDWLNKITDESVQFFGLEIELWRIGNSPVAPKFNMVCKPNDWSKTISQPPNDGELTDTKQTQLEYWTEFWNHLRSKNSFLKGTKALPQHWLNCSIGKTWFSLTAVIRAKQRNIAIHVTMSGPNGKFFFASLEAQRLQIEAEMGEPLLWEALPTKKESRVVLSTAAFDVFDRSTWADQHEWLRLKMEKLHKIFSPRIKQLIPETGVVGDD